MVNTLSLPLVNTLSLPLVNTLSIPIYMAFGDEGCGL
jgi:hypothetical protein